MRFNLSKLGEQGVKRLRSVLIIRGILAVLLGILMLAWPSATLLVVAASVAVFFCFSGIMHLWAAFVTADRLHTGLRVLNGVVGVLLIALSVIAVINPAASVISVALFIGLAWIFEGIMALASTPAPGQGMGWWIAFGIISVIAGISIFVFPGSAVATLVLVAGIFLIVDGVMDIVNGAMIRNSFKG